MSGIDIVIQIWKLLNVSPVTAMLGDGDIWQHNRPRNSKFTDIVISIPEYNSSALNTGFIDVNIHTPNIGNYYPIGAEDNTFPKLAVFKPLLDVILPLIVSTNDFSLSTKIAGVPIRDKDGEWYVNIRIAFEAINTVNAVDVSMFELNGTGDGYGGTVVDRVLSWQGLGVQMNIKTGNQLNIGAGRYELILSSDWIIPNDVTPKKNDILISDNGEYVINGIIPLNGFWQLSTLRKDERY